MKSFIVLRKFELTDANTGECLKYLRNEIYKENKLYVGWRVENDEFDLLQQLGYIIVIQDIYTLVRTCLLRKINR